MGYPADFTVNERLSRLHDWWCFVQKIITLQLVEIMPFLQYQSAKMKDPIGRLNHLEKLLQVNSAFFIEGDHPDKISCALIYIEEIKYRFKRLKHNHGSFVNELFYKNPFHEIKVKLPTLISMRRK